MPKRNPTKSPADEALPRRKRRPAEQVRALLLDAARAEFERAGYAGATTAAIAERAEATEAQLFRYFRTKAELFRVSVLDPINEAFETFNASRLDSPGNDADWAEQANRYIVDLSAFIREHEHLLMSLIVAQAYGGASVDGVAAVGGLKAYFDISARSMLAHAEGRPRVDPALMVRVSFGAVLASVLFGDWLFGGIEASPEGITAALADFVRDGIRIDAPASRRGRSAPVRARRGRRTAAPGRPSS